MPARPRQAAAAAVIGAVFGLVLCWSGMASPAVIRETLLFQDAYMFLFMGASVGTAAIGLRLVRRRAPRALLTDERVGWATDRPQRRHVTGSLVFGLGWGIANVCPGPVAAQVGQGLGWGFVSLAGVLLGVWLFQRQGAGETEPAADGTPAATGRRSQGATAPATA